MTHELDRIAIVTGTTSGIGEATMRKFVEAGFGVVGNGRRSEKLAAPGLERPFLGGRVNVSGLSDALSLFMLKNIPLFFQRFSLSYFREGACIEFFINPRDSSDVISSALILSYDACKKDLHVSRFYPELYHLPDSKYMSATCFFLLIQHCINVFALDDACHISLETVAEISERFYERLGDFDFRVTKHGLGNGVELTSGVMNTTLDTSMIRVHIFASGEIPFLKA